EAPRVLVVATARPEFTPPWPAGDVVQIVLARLGRDEVETMVNAGLASGRPLPRGVIEEVIRRTDGVPLFVEEVTRVLLERGVAARDADGAALDVANLDIPGTRRSAPTESYVFRHALVREAAYESMMRSARQKLHLRTATTLRERFPDVERSQPDLLALHFEHGGDLERAVTYWARAGDGTMSRGAYAEAIRVFERGLRLVARL